LKEVIDEKKSTGFIVMGGDSDNKIMNLRNLIRDFTRRRNWEPYHNPKDLALSISIEAAELLEVMQWREHNIEKLLTYPDFLPRVQEELADVMIYCISLANVLDLDISDMVRKKVSRNEEKYPVGKSL
jgi:NTP pyrophosphatase (non-canonical NTP hydrolase)